MKKTPWKTQKNRLGWEVMLMICVLSWFGWCWWVEGFRYSRYFFICYPLASWRSERKPIRFQYDYFFLAMKIDRRYIFIGFKVCFTQNSRPCVYFLPVIFCWVLDVFPPVFFQKVEGSSKQNRAIKKQKAIRMTQMKFPLLVEHSPSKMSFSA